MGVQIAVLGRFVVDRGSQVATKNIHDTLAASLNEMVIVGALSEMESLGVDRVVLDVAEMDPVHETAGRWINLDETAYYPTSFLHADELDMMLGGKSYQVAALASRNPGGFVEYGGRGIERVQRTHFIPMLPALKDPTNLKYLTSCHMFPEGAGIRQYAEDTAALGLTPEMFRETFEAGIERYHEKTQELMEDGGVYAALEAMEQIGYTPSEAMFSKMRDDMQAAALKVA